MDGSMFFVLMLIVLPLSIILHYITKWKSIGDKSPKETAFVNDLYKTAEKLENRLNVLERILDDEVPDWKDRHNDH